MSKLSQGSKILSDCKNNIIVQSTSVGIMLDCQIVTDHGGATKVEFLQEIDPMKSQLAKFSPQPQQKDINILHAKPAHPSEMITQLYEFCAMGKAEKVMSKTLQ